MMSRKEVIDSLSLDQPAGAKMKALSAEELIGIQAGGDVKPEFVGSFLTTVGLTVALSVSIGCGPNG